MFLFRSKDTDIVDTIDDLDKKNQILSERLANMSKPYNYIFISLVLISLSLGLFFQLDYWFTWAIPVVLAVIVMLIKFIRINYTKRQIRNNERQLTKNREIMENDEEIEQYKKFLTNFRNKIEKQPQARIKRSIPVQIFDWLFHTYSHNPHAIICPRCGVNNGLCDDPKTVQYYCMNCGCNEKGEEFEIVEEEDAENNEMNEVQEGKLE